MKRAPLLPCGTPFESEADARSSRRGQRPGARVEQCRNRACGKWHVRNAPLSPDRPVRPRGRRKGIPKPPGPRSARGSVKSAVEMVLAGQCTVAQAARETGADPEAVEARAWAEAKRLVMERDSWTCLATGGRAVDVHHRVPRGIGGTADPVLAFGMANLVAVTRAAHDLIHSGDPEMRRRGFLLGHWQKPELEPLILTGEDGSEARVRLTASGEYRTADPGERAA